MIFSTTAEGCRMLCAVPLPTVDAVWVCAPFEEEVATAPVVVPASPFPAVATKLSEVPPPVLHVNEECV
jgi:hypothetical protein